MFFSQNPHHVPHKVGQPVEEGLHSTDELHVFGFIHSLLDEEHHKAGRDERHGEDDADGHQHIDWGRHSGKQTGSKVRDIKTVC